VLLAIDNTQLTTARLREFPFASAATKDGQKTNKIKVPIKAKIL